jgi:DNA polymerase elongation subunit (family B)
MELTYEKTLMPFVLLSKKRYVGMLYETDPNKGKLKYMGLSLKRRDSCDYLKDVYGQILNILMKENSVQKAIDYLEGALNELIKGTVPMDKLTITKALRGDYKNPQQIAHRVLADRIGQRDPGNKPKPGDRMKFVHVVNYTKTALQGDKIETPEYIISNKLEVDYVFYITNQLMKPLQQLFGLALEQIWLNKGKHILVKTFKKDMQKLMDEVNGDIEVFMKKKEKYCSAKIKALLFDKFLTNIYNEKHKIQMITTFFAPLPATKK